jgi:hypothetical protein
VGGCTQLLNPLVEALLLAPGQGADAVLQQSQLRGLTLAQALER